MNGKLASLTMIVLAAALPAIAQPGPRGDVRGEVVEVRENVATANAGAATEIRVQTRNQESLWLRVNDPGSGAGLRVGDQIRARYETRDGAAVVTDLRNGRSGDRMRLHDQDRLRLRDGSCTTGAGGGGGRGAGNGNRGSGGGCPRRG
jgi:hypothetical protein